MMRGFLVIVALLAWVGPASAAGWTQPKGRFYIKGWGALIAGDSVYLANGDIAELPESYSDFGIRYHAEFGLTDEQTLVMSGNPLGWSRYGDTQRLYSGPVRLGLRQSLMMAPVAMAVELVYTYASGTCSDALLDRCDPLATGQIGDQRFVYLPALRTHGLAGELQIGRGFSWGWVSGAFGATFNTVDELGDAIYGNAQIGAQLPAGFEVDVLITAQLASGRIREANVTGVSKTTYIGYGLGLSWWPIDHFGLNLGIGGAMLARSNAATPALSLGIQFKGGPSG